jgi:hypothetical protein
MENKTDKNQSKTENKESLVFDHNKKDQAKIIKFSLVVLWVAALIFGIGFKLWFLFFIALFLTIAYLSGGKIKGCDVPNSKNKNSSLRDSHNHKKSIGHDWSSPTGSNLINSPSFSSFKGNIHNHRR